MIFVLLLISVTSRRMTTGRNSKLFILSIINGLLASCFDILAATFDYLPNADKGLCELFHILYMLFHSLQCPLYVLFIISFMNVWHKLISRKVFVSVFAAPYVITAALLLTNPFTNLIFSVENGYKHEALFPILYITTAYYIILDVIFIISGRKNLTRVQMLAMLSMNILGVTAIIVHLFFPHHLLECVAVALSCYILTATVQRPEENIDTITGLFKLAAYVRDTKNFYRTDMHWYVIMLNVGNFDNVAHLMGFESSMDLLKIIAGKLRAINKKLGNKGTVYYLDRARYRVVFTDKQKELAETYANMLNNELKYKIHHNGFDISLTPSIVLAQCPEDIESFKSLMAFGQDFHTRIAYTGRVMPAKEVYSPEEFQVANNIDAIIEKALENRSFQVYYQPIYSVEKKKFVSAEALLRLFDKEHGFISPEVIITAAERSGAIHKIGEFVFEEVCKFISSGEFDKLGLEYVEVNLSVAQCMHGDLADKILLIMQQYNVPSSKINLEITETAASFAQRVMTDNLNKLSRSGISFSLDDYGTGYSNMKRVISLPLKIVKLDKSFVDEQHNPKMWILLQNTVQMLKAMNMQIVVEGIETQEMVDVFSELKCDFIQGYFFSRPLPKADFVKLLQSPRESA